MESGFKKKKSTEPPARNSIQCPSCKMNSYERLYCSSCVTKAVLLERETHEEQRKQRDVVKDVLKNFLNERIQVPELAFEIQQVEQENRRMKELLEKSKQELSKITEMRKEWNDKLEKRRRELNHAKERMSKTIIYDRDVVAPIVNAMEQAAGNLEEIVATERRKKMEQLLDIFPLQVAEPGVYPVSTIAGIPLDFESKDRSRSSLALVLVARVIILAAHYLRISLPFRIEYKKGFGLVYRKNGPTSLDLRNFNDPGHRASVLEALRLLHFDVRMLCISQGLPSTTLSKNDSIDNLWQLFHSPSLGRSIHQAINDASLRENKVVSRIMEVIPTTKKKKGKTTEETEDDFVVVDKISPISSS